MVFRAIIALLASITLTNAGLTGTQIKQVMNFADSGGFIYKGSKDVQMIQNGHPTIKKVMVFYRPDDGSYACFDPQCNSVREAIDEFLGSMLMWGLKSQ
jgi:hypothetical protein